MIQLIFRSVKVQKLNTSIKLNQTITDLKTSNDNLTSELGKKHEDEKKQKEALESLSLNFRAEIENLQEIKEKQQKEIENLLKENKTNTDHQANNLETIKELKKLNEEYAIEIKCKEQVILEESKKNAVLEDKITNYETLQNDLLKFQDLFEHERKKSAEITTARDKIFNEMKKVSLEKQMIEQQIEDKDQEVATMKNQIKDSEMIILNLQKEVKALQQELASSLETYTDSLVENEKKKIDTIASVTRLMAEAEGKSEAKLKQKTLKIEELGKFSCLFTLITFLLL